MGCGVSHRHGLYPALLWLWGRLTAVALIKPLAWEPPYAVGAAVKRQKEKKKEEAIPVVVQHVKNPLVSMRKQV